MMDAEKFDQMLETLVALTYPRPVNVLSAHAPGCYAWGPDHYQCALDRIEELESER